MSSTVPARAGTRAARSARDIGEAVARREIVESGGHLADRAVALLADDDLGGAVHLLEPVCPFLIGFVEFAVVVMLDLRRLFARQIIFFAEDEHHDVRVLLDRARLA